MMHDSSENVIRYFRELLLSSVIDTTASLFHYLLKICWDSHQCYFNRKIFSGNYILLLFLQQSFFFFKLIHNARFILQDLRLEKSVRFNNDIYFNLTIFQNKKIFPDT